MTTSVKNGKRERTVTKKKTKPYISNRVKLEILSMYENEKMTQQAIADYFKIRRETVSRILKNARGNRAYVVDLGATGKYDPTAVFNREQLDPFERAKLVAKDAMQNTELTLSLMNHLLVTTAESVAKGGDVGVYGIKMDQLTRFFQYCAPYVLEKKELGKHGDKGRPKEGRESKFNKFLTLKKAE